MPQDNIVDLQIGQNGDLVSGELFIDYTTNTISGPGLTVNVLGDSVALGADALTLQPNSDGSYTIVGATVGVGSIPVANVSLTLGSQNPGSVDASVTALGLTSTQVELVTQVTCFVTGTLIRTSRGEVAVEDLSVGDRAMTPGGDARRICWIGHRTIDLRHHARPHEVYPVRVSAHAFGEGRPARDLFLSPGHPVLVDADEDGAGGHLVPIMCLVNGTTIERVAKDEVTYWHIELEQHDILLAENLPAESYLDWGDRAFFTEGVDHALANPDFVVPGLAARCRPVAIDGPIVEAERRRLDIAFESRLISACAWPSAETSAFL